LTAYLQYGLIVVLLKGIGDSAQGFANCILFVLLVPSVRRRYQQAVCSCCGRHLTRSLTATENDDDQRRHRLADSGDCKRACYDPDIPLSESPVVVNLAI